LVQLEELGALDRDGAKYVIGGAMFVIGDGWRPEPTLRKMAQPAIRQLAVETGGSVMLTLRRSQELVVVAGSRGEADKVTPTLLTFGTRLAPATAAGQALVNEIFAIDREGVIPGLSCVAAPIYGASGDAIASLAIGVTRSVLDPIIDTVERAAEALTAQLCA
jgi:DNA-binding IclR family transcriptional regulator